MKTTIKYLGRKENFTLDLQYLKCSFDENNMATVDDESACRLIRENPKGFAPVGIVGFNIENPAPQSLPEENTDTMGRTPGDALVVEVKDTAPLSTSTKNYKTSGTANMAIAKKEGMSRETHEAVETDDGFIIAPIQAGE